MNHSSHAIESTIRRVVRRLHLKGLARFAGNLLFARPVFRRFATANFTSGKLALGEQNTYMFPPRWVTVDVTGADVSLRFTEGARLPFPDESQDLIYSAHMIEHLDDAALEACIAECARVLKPHGHARFEAPDAEFLISAYRAEDANVLDYFREDRRARLVEELGLPEKYLEDHLMVLGEVSSYIDFSRNSGHIPVYASRQEFERYLERSIEEFNSWAQLLKTEEQRLSGGHNTCIYYAKLESLLKGNGFSKVVRQEFGATMIGTLSLNRSLRGVYDSVPEKSQRAFYSLYVDARK